MLKNPGKCFFMDLVVVVVKYVNEQRDQRRLNFA